MSHRFSRPLWQALLLSLLIHALLLVGVVSDFPDLGDVPAATLRVSMGKGRQEETARAAAKSSAVPEPVAVPGRLVSSSASNRPAPPAPVSDSAVVSHAENPDTKKAGASESRGAVDASSSGTVGKHEAESASASRDGVKPDDMRQYRMALAAAMRRFKRYPPLARDRGWEGTAHIGLTVSSRSAAPEIVLSQSSGRGLLDEQAMEMVSQAVRVTHLPEGLKGKSFRVVLPVQFSLENE